MQLSVCFVIVPGKLISLSILMEVAYIPAIKFAVIDLIIGQELAKTLKRPFITKTTVIYEPKTQKNRDLEQWQKLKCYINSC